MPILCVLDLVKRLGQKTSLFSLQEKLYIIARYYKKGGPI